MASGTDNDAEQQAPCCPPSTSCTSRNGDSSPFMYSFQNGSNQTTKTPLIPKTIPSPTKNNSEPTSLNRSNNILLVYRLEEMQGSANLNFSLALFCLAYCGVNITLIYVNYINALHDAKGLQLPVADKAFHLIEFWATFGFAVVECVALMVSTPKSLLRIYDDPLFLKLLLFFNIVATLVPALMVSLNLEQFELISHEIEYINELTMSFVDLIILYSLCKWESASIAPAVLACTVALVQLAVYNLMGRTEDGDMVGEVPAHYCEFAFEIISSLIAFWFCMDNKFVADKEIGSILYGRHRDCLICDAKSDEFAQTYVVESSGRYGAIGP